MHKFIIIVIISSSTAKWLILVILIIENLAESKQSYKMVCYFTNWAVLRPGLGSMKPEHIDPCLCTHIIYAFSNMKDYKLHSVDKIDTSDGKDGGFFERINNLKKQNSKLRTLLAVGGWEMGMKAFSEMVKDEKYMKRFVDTSIEYLRKWNFDGLDLDFEYPGIDWRGSQPSDKFAFTKLCKMLREGYEAEAKKTGKERLLLTAAVAGAKNTIDKAYEVDKVSNYLDWWNLMTYDLHGPWDTNAGHHSALVGKYKDDFLYIDFIVKHYISKGAPREKLVLGLANYGRSDAPAMPYTGFKGESGFLSYYESCLMLSCEKWKEFWNEAQLVPFAKGKENWPWAGFDNVRSMKIKAEYIIKQNLSGAMFWTLDLDDFTSKFCCQGYYPLIRTVKSVLEDDPTLMPPKSICKTCPSEEYKKVKNTNTKEPTTTRIMRLKSKNILKKEAKKEDKVKTKIKLIQEKMKKNKKKKDKKLKKEKEVKSPTREKRAAVRTPHEVCQLKGNGKWPDPTDCKKYYLCRNYNTAWAEIAHETCWQGSYFDKNEERCKYIGGNTDYECDESESDDLETTTLASSILSLNTSELAEINDEPDPEVLNTLSTCRPDYENNPDYIRCFDCDSKKEAQCNYRPANNSIDEVWCNVKKNKRCFSKAVYKAPNNMLQSFIRGCATLNELVGPNMIPTRNYTKGFCFKTSNTTKSCVILCESSFCNKEVTGRAGVRTSPTRPHALKLESTPSGAASAANSNKDQNIFNNFFYSLYNYLN